MGSEMCIRDSSPTAHAVTPVATVDTVATTATGVTAAVAIPAAPTTVVAREVGAMHYPVPEGNFATRTGTSGAVGSPITGTGGGCDAGGGYGGGRYRGGYAIGGPAQAPAAARVEDMAVRRDPIVDSRRAATGAATCHRASPRHVLAPRVDVAGGVPLSMHCLLYTSPSPRDLSTSRMPSSA